MNSSNPDTIDQQVSPAADALPREFAEAEGSWILDRARCAVYQFLAVAAASPHSASWSRLLNQDFQELGQAAVAVIREDPTTCPDALAPGEVAPGALDLAPLLSFLQVSRDQLIQEYDRIFGLLISRECPPHETEYCPQTFSVYRSHQLADIAGYYRAFGLEPSGEHPERQDHIVLELEFMAWLIGKTLYASQHGDADQVRVCRDAQVSFFRDHFAWWTPAFALALRRKADGMDDMATEQSLTLPPQSFQGAIGAFLAAFVPAERGILGISPPTELAAPVAGEEESQTDCGLCSNTDSEPEYLELK
jgi:TorA maturation chaperone TorD